MPCLQLDVNDHYAPATKQRLADAMCRTCAEMMTVDIRRISVAIREDRLNVEFTQHTGDEMYHPALGGYSPDWTPDEA